MKHWSERYEKIQQIGQGASGKIHKIIKKDTKQILAAKIINIDIGKDQFGNIEQEVKIMSSCNHKNIIQCCGIQLFVGQVWILMQFCQNGSLSDIMRQKKNTFNEGEIRQILRQVLEGLSYLHSNNIVHRDIKASNLLCHRGIIKIADFGVSIVNNMENKIQSKFNRIGSPYWMSPEILSDSIYNQKTDIWALGITAIQLAEGEPPFSHQHPFRAIYSIQTHPPEGLKIPNNYSSQFNAFIKECLTLDYKKRPTSKTLLQHKFISQLQFTESLLHSPISQRIQNEEADNTIIMYDDIPKSIWEKESYPQSQEKEMKEADTVIIKNSGIKESKIQYLNEIQSIINDKQANLIVKKVKSIQQRELQVQQLYGKMQLQIKQIRTKYMQKIKSIYNDNLYVKKENKVWNSVNMNLKQKKKSGRQQIDVFSKGVNKYY